MAALTEKECFVNTLYLDLDLEYSRPSLVRSNLDRSRSNIYLPYSPDLDYSVRMPIRLIKQIMYFFASVLGQFQCTQFNQCDIDNALALRARAFMGTD